MLHVNRVVRSGLQLLPPVLAWALTLARRPLALLLIVPCLFAAVACFPPARRHESLWMFLLVAVTGVPVNIAVIILAAQYPFLTSDLAPLTVLRCALLYMMLFSAEQLSFGSVTRLIWPRQVRIRIKK